MDSKNPQLDAALPEDVVNWLMGKSDNEPVPPTGSKYIGLTQGYFTLVSDTDYPILAAFPWQITGEKNWLYAKSWLRGLSKKPVIMHRLIMGAPEGYQIDHINRCGLDNRRCNLRVCTNQQNSFNSEYHKGRSRYRGVHWAKRSGKWRVQYTLNGRRKYIGMFADEIEAAKAYDAKVIEHYGEFARPNFPLTERSVQ